MEQDKIAIITPGILPVPSISGGAVETLTSYIIEGYSQRNEDVIDVYTCSDNGLNNIHLNNVNIIQLPISIGSRVKGKLSRVLQKYLKFGRGYTAFQYELKKNISLDQYKIVLFENCMRNVCILKKKDKSQLWIYHMHNDIEPKFNDKSTDNLLEVDNKCNYILACSNYIKNRCKEFVNANKIITFYNAVDTRKFYPYEDNSIRDKIRERYGIDTDGYLFLYSGRIVEEKGIDLLIDAFYEIKDDKTFLLIVGNLKPKFPQEVEYVEKILSRRDVYQSNKHIIFTDSIDYDQIVDYYNAADCIVFPSQINESFGMAIVEAMATKKPVVLTRTGGSPEVVDEKCAIIVSMGKQYINELIDAMKKLRESPEKSRIMGENGYKRISEKYEFQKDHYFEIYDNYLKNMDIDTGE